MNTIQETAERLRTAQRERKALERRKPRCEVCLKKPAVSFSRFRDGQWLFSCYCTSDYETYDVMISEYSGSHGARAEWDSHFAGKSEWFNVDGFYRAVGRWVDAGGRMK